MTTHYTDKDLIKAIKKGGNNLSTAANYMYQDEDYKQSIIKLIHKHKGSLQDAEDIFQDGIRHLIVNIRKGKFEEKSSLKTYLSVICKNLWLTKFNRQIKLQEIKTNLKVENPVEPSPEGIFILKEQADLLNTVLGKLGDSCKTVLGKWSLGYSFKEIANLIGKSEGAVRKQKHDCFKKLMRLMKSSPDLVKQLID